MIISLALSLGVVSSASQSLLPAQDMVRTGLPGRVGHFIADAGGRLRSLWPDTTQPKAPRRSSAAFGFTPAFWSTSSTSLPVGIPAAGSIKLRSLFFTLQCVGRLAGTLFPSLGCSFDQLVSKIEHARGNGETEGVGSLEVDIQRKFRWLPNR